MTDQKLFEEFRKINESIDINQLMTWGVIGAEQIEKILICYEFENIKDDRGRMQAYTDLSEKFCKSESTIMRIVNIPVVVY